MLYFHVFIIPPEWSPCLKYISTKVPYIRLCTRYVFPANFNQSYTKFSQNQHGRLILSDLAI